MPPRRTALSFALLLVACGGTPSGSDESGSGTESSTGSGETTTGGGEEEDTGDTGTDESSTTTGGNTSECSMYAQDCPDGEKCNWWVVDTEIVQVCVPVTGSRAVGETCLHQGIFSGEDDCDADGLCYGAVEIGLTWTGICRAYCGGTANAPVCEDLDYICSRGDLPACLPGCDPLLQDCVDASEMCWYQDDIPGYVCGGTSEKANVGDTCLVPFDCRKGLTCQAGAKVPACTGEECCTEFCDFGAPNTCAAAGMGAECVNLMVEEFPNVGACLIPD